MRTRVIVLVMAAAPCVPAAGDCRPDCNTDGKLNINDFICFQAAWRAPSRSNEGRVRRGCRRS